jgi:hypothetical protein
MIVHLLTGDDAHVSRAFQPPTAPSTLKGNEGGFELNRYFSADVAPLWYVDN